MKKIILFLIMGILVSQSAFAMAKKPNFNTKYGCFQKPYYECKQYGNPWTKADMPKWNACAEPIIEDCKFKYGA